MGGRASIQTPAQVLRRGPLERLLAWLATGPLGHLYSVLADLLSLVARSAARRPPD